MVDQHLKTTDPSINVHDISKKKTARGYYMKDFSGVFNLLGKF